MTSKHINALRLALLSLAISILVLPGLPAFAQDEATTAEQCMLDLFKTGGNELTLGEIREQCPDPAPSVPVGKAQRRIIEEREASERPFSILAHKPNYVLAAAYNFEGWDSSLYQLKAADPTYENKDVEAQFQISLKVPLARNLFGNHMDIYAAYTNRSFWQMYNREHSEPFRETNHEPEMWLQFRNTWSPYGFTNAVNAVGFIHQSNGQAGSQSRSWNRIFANFIFEKDDFALSFKPWIWVSQNKTESDNPDITNFLGHGEFRATWERSDHVVSMMLRNQLESGFDRGAVELSWSIPVFNYKSLKGYIQYFYGYGESLIDYDRKVNRIGVGISVTDWID